MDGQIWLWPLLLPPLLAVLGPARAGKSRRVGLGLAWLVLEATLIGHKGWTVAALSGFGQPSQAPLGWGALGLRAGLRRVPRARTGAALVTAAARCSSPHRCC